MKSSVCIVKLFKNARNIANYLWPCILFTMLIMKLYYNLCNWLIHILAATPLTKRGRVFSCYNWWAVTEEHNYCTARLNLSCIVSMWMGTIYKSMYLIGHGNILFWQWLDGCSFSTILWRVWCLTNERSGFVRSAVFPLWQISILACPTLKIRICSWLIVGILAAVNGCAVDSQFSLTSVTCVHIFKLNNDFVMEEGTISLLNCSCVHVSKSHIEKDSN